jgi:2-methylisocitrate lyase-like PEP mutase family enzyme
VSLGSSLARAAYGAFLDAAREIRDTGTFDFAARAAPYAALNDMFKRPSAEAGHIDPTR